ncbi:MAG: type 4a pilus biogenesis protein PilO [Colwellia sp.]
MKFDASQFEDLDLENIGQWPPLAKIVLAIFLAITVAGLTYVGLVSDKIDQLKRVQAEEKTLVESYKAKYHVAANLELFRAQMAEAEEMFATQLRSLPDSHEIPGLLDDITFIGTTSGLEFVTLKWKPEVQQEIYIELPIDIEVNGSYHALGHFVSKIAGLPRIVTLHDFQVTVKDKDGTGEVLNLKLKAKTYRYQEEG